MSFRAALTPAVCLALLSFNVHAAEKRLDRSFDVKAGGTLTVVSDGGDITVSGSDSNQVVVKIVVTGSQGTLDDMVLSAEPSSNGIAVTSKRESDGWLGWLHSTSARDAKITITVPRRYSVDLKSAGGDLKVTHLQGDAVGATSGGDVHVGSVSGKVRMRTSGGDIDASDIQGDTQIHTSGGEIIARAITGQLEAKTSGGTIQLQQIKGPTRAHTSSGDVTAIDMQGDTSLDSSGGSIRASIDGKIRAATSGGDVEIELVGANRGIAASTSGGNVVLRVSKDITGTLTASTSGGSVSSDLPVAATQSRESRLSGAINGGGETIAANTSGGDVRLRARN